MYCCKYLLTSVSFRLFFSSQQSCRRETIFPKPFIFKYLSICLCWVLVAACMQDLCCHVGCFLGTHGLSGCGEISCSMACGLLVPQPRVEPASPTLQGGFLTTGSPGSPSPIPFTNRLYHKTFKFLPNLNMRNNIIV